MKYRRWLDVTGKKFGSVTVIDDGGVSVLAKCDCGKEWETYKYHLEQIKSCGCQRTIDLKGRKFGRATVIERLDGGRAKCQCDCGRVFTTSARLLMCGSTKSCGCLQRERVRERIGVFVSVNGERKTLSDWGKFLGITRERARQLHQKGRLVERIKSASV